MPIEFKLDQRLVGFAATTAGPAEKVAVVASDLIPPGDTLRLARTLEHLQSVLFDFVPGFPRPAVIDHLFLVIRPDLSGTAYINDVHFNMKVKVNRPIQQGAAVFLKDIEDVSSFEPNVEVPDDCAVVVVRSAGWKRSVYFDFGPLLQPPRLRTEPLNQILARQAVVLLGIPNGAGAPARSSNQQSVVDRMAIGYQDIRKLLDDGCQSESAYQQLLEQHPWMLGGQYESIQRHTGLDDANIPDFTAQRSWDKCHDILELKQPFMKCFRADGEFSAEFNAAWNQAERYVAFARRQRDYLREEKKLRFENPRCLLIGGHKIDDDQLKKLREKETMVLSISVLTYDQLLNLASHVLYLMRLSATGSVNAG